MICFDTWNHIFWHHSTRMSLIFQFFGSGWSLISLLLTKTLHWVSPHNRSVYNLDRDAFIAQIGGVSSNSYSSQISLLSTQCLLRNLFPSQINDKAPHKLILSNSLKSFHCHNCHKIKIPHSYYNNIQEEKKKGSLLFLTIEIYIQ